MSERVKTKVIELLYSWTLALPEESKIKDAYHMLKRQGVCRPSLSLHAARKAAFGPDQRDGGGASAGPLLRPFLLKTAGRAWLGFEGTAPLCRS